MCGTRRAAVKGATAAVHAPVTNAGYRPGVVAAREPAVASHRSPASERPAGHRYGDPRREIVAAASQLFTERGVAGTTMAEIARRCGLQQPSLYYYFRSKGELLDEIVGEANRAPLELVARVREAGGSPAVQLYRVIRSDVAALCALPYDLNEIHRLAARDRDAFARYWTEREQLVDELAAIVADGVARGELRAGRSAPHRAHADVERRGHAELVAGRRARRRAGAVVGGASTTRSVRSSPISPCGGCSSPRATSIASGATPTRSTPPPSSPDATARSPPGLAATRQARETGVCFEGPSTETAHAVPCLRSAPSGGSRGHSSSTTVGRHDRVRRVVATVVDDRR